jgi:hypothetical protein
MRQQVREGQQLRSEHVYMSYRTRPCPGWDVLPSTSCPRSGFSASLCMSALAQPQPLMRLHSTEIWALFHLFLMLPVSDASWPDSLGPGSSLHFLTSQLLPSYSR